MATSEASPLQEMGIFPVTDPEVTQCVNYLSNLAFSDLLDPCKNSKFPGGLAVSLSRDLLPRLYGHRAHHMPYEKTDLLAWIHPTERVIPPTQFGEGGALRRGTAQRSGNFALGSSSGSAAGATADVLQLDFGSDTGLLEVAPVLCIVPSLLDFGSDNGLFLIVGC